MKKTVLLLLAAFLIVSCQEIINPQRPDDYWIRDGSKLYWEKVFDGFWTGMNHNYVFWDIDPTDWDSVYREYRPKFAALDALPNKQDDPEVIQQAKGYFIEITQDLVDCHYELRFENAEWGNINPCAARYFRRYGADYYDHNTWIGDIERSDLAVETSAAVYMIAQNYVVGDHKGYDDGSFYASTGRIPLEPGSDILYFQFSNFTWTDFFQNTTDPALLAVWDYFVDNLHMPDVKGVIVDLRGNGGGNALDLSLIWGKMFTEEKHLIGYNKLKMGEGRLDYAPLTPFYLFSDPVNSKDLKVPLVLLVNNLSISCSEISALFVRSFPNGFIVGGTTWGGQGPLTDNMVYNAGQFSTLEIHLTHTSSMQTLDLNKKSHEGKGIEPDYPVPLDYNKFTAGIDTRLEKAIEVIKAQ